jgi:hypothetical protein
MARLGVGVAHLDQLGHHHGVRPRCAGDRELPDVIRQWLPLILDLHNIVESADHRLALDLERRDDREVNGQLDHPASGGMPI